MFSLWLSVLTTIALAEHRPSKKGAFCCDNTGNMVSNGNFEFGNAYFSSEYSYDYDTLPGQYVVTNSASQFEAEVNDHSTCESGTVYPTNYRFLLVNGLVSMSAGSTAVIWEQTIGGLNSGSEYRFCGNFKNLPQCTYDVLPMVTVQLSTGISHTVTIDTDPDNACDWQKISFCFRAATKVTFQILLKEDSLGDGNDLAIDDISVQELIDPMLSTTVQHQWGTQLVLASINTINSNDDSLPYNPEICPWFWFVFPLSSNGNGFDSSLPWGVGNLDGSIKYNPYVPNGPSWGLTTTFPGFTFVWGKMYVVGMMIRQCCEGCIVNGWTAHVVNINNSFPWWKQSVEKTITKGESLSGSKSEEEYSRSGLKVTSSKSGLNDKNRLISEKDLMIMKEMMEKYESSKTNDFNKKK